MVPTTMPARTKTATTIRIIFFMLIAAFYCISAKYRRCLGVGVCYTLVRKQKKLRSVLISKARLDHCTSNCAKPCNCLVDGPVGLRGNTSDDIRGSVESPLVTEM